MRKSTNGFTIVELLIVIIVVAILAAITLVTYNGIQQRARDSQRLQDVKSIAKIMELFYTENGYYPNATTYTPGSTTLNAAWASTADASWANLETVLKPYAAKLPRDPISTPNGDTRSTGIYNYQIFVNQSTYCNVAPGQVYIINYRLESSAQADNLLGADCSTNPIGPYVSSDYRVVK